MDSPFSERRVDFFFFGSESDLSELVTKVNTLVAGAFTEALVAPELCDFQRPCTSTLGARPCLDSLPGFQRGTLGFKVDLIFGEVSVVPFRRVHALYLQSGRSFSSRGVTQAAPSH